jgi:hypothetical protein
MRADALGGLPIVGGRQVGKACGVGWEIYGDGYATCSVALLCGSEEVAGTTLSVAVSQWNSGEVNKLGCSITATVSLQVPTAESPGTLVLNYMKCDVGDGDPATVHELVLAAWSQTGHSQA